jgi:hypothetical protein
MLQGCPCNTQALCEADRMGNFGQGCHWNSNTPGFWYFGHGGQCLLYTYASHCTARVRSMITKDYLGHGGQGMADTAAGILAVACVCLMY